MTEKQFIRELRDYFVDVEWTEHAEKRVLAALAKFRESNVTIKERVTIKPIDRVVYRERIVYKNGASLYTAVKTQPNLETMLGFVAEKTGLSVAELKSRCRKKEFIDARRLFVITALKTYNYSLKAIGRVLCKDHTTIINLRNTYVNLYGDVVPDIYFEYMEQFEPAPIQEIPIKDLSAGKVENSLV